jgi:hypothetical protein
LSAGNVTGHIYKPGGTEAAEGAIVFAEAYSGGSAVSGVTAEGQVENDGSFGLQLDTAYSWKLKVFYVNRPGETQLASITTPIDVVFTNGSAVIDRTLVVKP